MISKARMCFMLTLLVCLIGCQIRDPADPILETPTIIAPAPEVGHSVTTTPIVTATPSTSPEGGFLEILDEAILLVERTGIIAVDPHQGTRYEIDMDPETIKLLSGTAYPVSPDGRWLFYLTETVSGYRHTLVFLELSTGKRMTYPVPPTSPEGFWLHDSQHILLSVLENNSIRVLWLFDVFQGTHTVVRESFSHYEIEDVSPEGNYLYIVKNEGQFDLMSGTIAGGPPITLTTGIFAQQARYSPDGSKIVVLANDPAQGRVPSPPCCYCFDAGTNNNTAYILEVSLGVRHEISLPPHTLLSRFSPDGSRLLYQDIENCEMCAANLPICIFDIETEQSHCIDPQGLSLNLTWSPDGEKLAFIYNAPESASFLGVYDLRTGVAKIFYDYEIKRYRVQWVRLRPASEP